MLSITLAVALLGAVSGANGSKLNSRQTEIVNMDSIASRFANQSVIGDACHPKSRWKFPAYKGVDPLIPPCISEQIVTRRCEDKTVDAAANGTAAEKAAAQQALKKCYFYKKSSYVADRTACLKCKVEQGMLSKVQADLFLEAFRKADKEWAESCYSGSLWSIVERLMNWDLYNVSPPTLKGNDSLTFADYYDELPSEQNIGSFSFKGTNFPLPDHGTKSKMQAWKVSTHRPERLLAVGSVYTSENIAVVLDDGDMVEVSLEKLSFQKLTVVRTQGLEIPEISELNKLAEHCVNCNQTATDVGFEEVAVSKEDLVGIDTVTNIGQL